MPTAHQQPQPKTPRKSAPTWSRSGDHAKTPTSKLSLGSRLNAKGSTSESFTQSRRDTPTDAAISPADHNCRQQAHRLKKKLRTSLTHAQYVRELLLGSLHPSPALWLSQEGK